MKSKIDEMIEPHIVGTFDQGDAVLIEGVKTLMVEFAKSFAGWLKDNYVLIHTVKELNKEWTYKRNFGNSSIGSHELFTADQLIKEFEIFQTETTNKK